MNTKLISLHKSKWSWTLIYSGLATLISTAIPLGYNIGAMSSQTEFMIDWCNRTWSAAHKDAGETSTSIEIQLSATVILIFSIGGCVGSLIGAWLSNVYGRKGALRLCRTLFMCSAIMFISLGYIKYVEMLILARFTAGIAAGLTTTVLPMYLVEIAPLELRGFFAALTTLGIGGGVVIANVMSRIEFSSGLDYQWWIPLSGFVLPVLASYIFLDYIPESPRYAFAVTGRKAAQIVLEQLRGSTNSDCVNEELEAMESEFFKLTNGTISLSSMFKDRKFLMPLLLVCALQIGQQLSGATVIVHYSNSFLKLLDLSPGHKGIVLFIGCCNFVAAALAPVFVHWFNRCTIVLASCLLNAAAPFVQVVVDLIFIRTISIFFCFIFAVLNYTIVCPIGLGSISYFIASELFEVPSRSSAMAIGSFTSWLFNFLIGFIFLLIGPFFIHVAFFLFAINSLLLAKLIYHYLPETKGKQSTDIAPLISDGFKSKIQ